MVINTNSKKEDGTLETKENLRAWHILSNSDMVTLNPDNLTVYKTFEDEFIGHRRLVPLRIFMNSADLFLLNAGVVHTLRNSSANIGKLGLPKFRDADVFSNVGCDKSWPVFGFSNETKSFGSFDAFDTVLSHMAEADTDNPVQISPEQCESPK